MASSSTLPPSLRPTNRHRWPVADQVDLQQRHRGEKQAALGLLAWTQRYRALLNPTTVFDLERHKYLAGVYECQAAERAIMKPGQSGISEYAVSYALHALDQRRMNVLYMLPTVGDISDFSQMRIGPALEASAYLAGLVVDGHETGKKGTDRVRLKRLRGNFLVLRGAQVRTGQAGERRGASQIKAVPADAVVFDEFDEMPPGVEALGEKRLGHSETKEQIFLSTPTFPGVGIHVKWLQSDQRLWFVPCPHCGERQEVTIGDVVTEWDDLERPAHWHGEGEGRAWPACRRCGRELDRLAAGEWVATYPGRELAGFSFNKLVTAQNDPLAVVMALRTTDPYKRQEAFNQDLGQPYRPRGGGLTETELDGARRTYGHGPVSGERGCVMGVDVGRFLHVVIRGPVDTETGERPQRWAGVVAGFEEAGRLMRRFRVRTCVMDALPETRKAREFQEGQDRGRVWLAYYGEAVDRRAEMAHWKDEEGAVTLDRTRMFDEVFASMQDGGWTLPGDIRAVADYYPHLQAPVRVLERSAVRGVTVARYVETGPDHFAHAELYALAATMAPRPSLAVGVLAQGRVKGGWVGRRG